MMHYTVTESAFRRDPTAAIAQASVVGELHVVDDSGHVVAVIGVPKPDDDRRRCTIKRLPGGCGCGYKAEVGIVVTVKLLVTEVHDDHVMTEDGVAVEHGRYMFSGDPRGRAE